MTKHVDDATLRRMCHLVTHDLRNPLAAIVTNLEFARRVLDEATPDPDLAEALADSVTACDVLRRIISNFDLVAKGASLQAVPRSLVIQPLVQDVVRKSQAGAAQAELTIAMQLGDDVEVSADRDLLGIAFENLLANSIQHAPSRSTIDVTVTTVDGAVEVGIADRGSVLEGERALLALSVEAHTMDGRQPDTRYGRGLGLLCAQLAAQATGGEVRLDSRDGRNRFVLSLAPAG